MTKIQPRRVLVKDVAAVSVTDGVPAVRPGDHVADADRPLGGVNDA